MEWFPGRFLLGVLQNAPPSSLRSPEGAVAIRFPSNRGRIPTTSLRTGLGMTGSNCILQHALAPQREKPPSKPTSPPQRAIHLGDYGFDVCPCKATIRPCAPLFINLKYLTIDFCKVLYYNRGKKNSVRFDGNKTAISCSGITERRAGGKEGIELCPHPDSPAVWKTR